MKTSKYSFFDIVNPFYIRPLREVYDNLTRDQRLSFWSVTVTFIATIITAWLGFSVANNIQTNADKLNAKILRYELVDRFYDTYSDYMRVTSGFNTEFLSRYESIANDNTSNKSKEELLQDANVFFFNNRATLLQIGDTVIHIVSRMAPYFSLDVQDTVNNKLQTIMTGMYIVSSFQQDSMPSGMGLKAMIVDYMESQDLMMFLSGSKVNELEAIVNEFVQALEQLSLDEKRLLISTCLMELVYKPIAELNNVISAEIYPRVEERSVNHWLILLLVLCVGGFLYRIVVLSFVGRKYHINVENFNRTTTENEQLSNDVTAQKEENSMLQALNILLHDKVKEQDEEIGQLKNLLEAMKAKRESSIKSPDDGINKEQ